MNARTFAHAVSMEARTLLSYRADFWTNFLFGVLSFAVANYFLWDAVYRARGVEVIGGYTLPDMVLYTLLTACLTRIAFAGMRGTIAQEIYSGGLNKYLVFPVSFQAFKYAAHLAYGLIAVAQLVLALCVARVFVGAEPFARFSPGLFVLGLGVALLAGFAYFALSALMEMVAFWADNVWSLGVLLRFITLFCGGGMAPLTLYPEWAQEVLRWTPFPYILSFPIRCLQGVATAPEIGFGLTLLICWSLGLAGCVSLLYRRGLTTYSGVGI